MTHTTRLAFAAALVLLAPAAALAQTVQGTVVEEGTGTPIAGAVVQMMLPGTTDVASAQTNQHGAFLLRSRRAGTLGVFVRHIGYATVETELEVGTHESVTIEVRMARRAIPLEPIVVTARTSSRLDGFHERRQRPGSGQFITRAELERRRGAQATDVLRGLPGVEITALERCRHDQCGPLPISAPAEGITTKTHLIVMRRTGGVCFPAIFIDGMRAYQRENAGIDDLLTPDMLEGVEIYSRWSTAPPELFDPNGCGVVAFWTRSDRHNAFTWRRLVAGAGVLGAMALFSFNVAR